MTDENGSNATQTAPPPPAPPPSPPVTGTVTPPPEHHSRGGGAATAGVILILIGALMLIGRVTGQVNIWQMWPLFVIVPGLVQCVTPGSDGWSVHRFFDGLVTVAIGAILLGNSTGWVSWGVWWVALQMWPVLLISAGLGILGKATGQNWIRVAGTLVVLVALGLAVSSSVSGMPMTISTGTSSEKATFSEPVTTSRASLSIKSGAGEIRIEDTDDRTVEIESESPFGDPSFSVDRDGAKTEVDFALTESGSIRVLPSAPASRVEAQLSDRTAWEIVIDSGVATLDADLSDLEVESFALKTGVSSNTVRLGDPPQGGTEGRVTIDSGVASVKVLVPEDAQVRIDADSGLTGFEVSELIGKRGPGEWRSNGFDAAQAAGRPVWVITAKSGLGSFEVDTY